MRSHSETEDLLLKLVRYIHGGAWRDPLVDASSFATTVDLLASTEVTHAVAGYASINYRLSPYPNHPTKPSSADDPSRNAEHPDHINDVTRALFFLEEKYKISGRYVLVGHSCGATLAFQVPIEYNHFTMVPQPACIIGSEGIYDIPSLVKVHDHVPYYRQFCCAAFGNVEKAWVEASPYTAKTQAIWANTRTLIISHSEEDDLVEKEQATKMLERFAETPEWHGQSRYTPVTGSHNETWEKGTEMAKIILEGLDSWRLGRLASPVRGKSHAHTSSEAA